MKSLKNIYTAFDGIPALYIDGTLAVSIALLTFWQSVFGGDEAAKWLNPHLLFWLKNMIGGLALSLVTLQSFRSKVFTRHSDEKERKKIADETSARLEDNPGGIVERQTLTEETTLTTTATKPTPIGVDPASAGEQGKSKG